MVGRVNRDGDWKKEGVYMEKGTNGVSVAEKKRPLNPRQ